MLQSPRTHLQDRSNYRRSSGRRRVRDGLLLLEKVGLICPGGPGPQRSERSSSKPYSRTYSGVDIPAFEERPRWHTGKPGFCQAVGRQEQMGDDRMKIAKKAVCLCSGGMDSTTAATIAKRAGYELYLFHVNYGQKAEKKELEVISKLKEALGAADLVSVDIDLFRDLSALTSAEAAIPTGDQ